MATVYKVEIVSHWINYSEIEMQKVLTEALNHIEKQKKNEISVDVKRQENIPKSSLDECRCIRIVGASKWNLNGCKIHS